MSEEFKELSVNALVLPKFNVRVESDCAVEMLAQSLKDNGVLQPLLVRPLGDGRYEVICGSRRLQAALKVGLQTVPCKIKAMSDMEAMEAMLVENLQREGLSDYEVGRWFKLLMERFPDKYPNLQTVAKRFGYKSHVMVSYLISHYEFVENTKQKVSPNIVTQVTMLPERFIREIRRAPEDLQPKLVRAVCDKIEKCEREKREGKEDVDFPTARDVATLVDSYIMKWDRELKAKEEEKREAEKPEKFELLPEEIEKRELMSRLEAEKPEAPPTKPQLPSEEEVGARLEEVMRKRREEERKQREEAMVTTLYTYYPERFLRDVESFFGVGAPLDKIQRLAYYTVEVTWYRLSDMYKIEILREVRSWID